MNYIKLPFIYNKIEFLNSFYIFSKKYNNYLKIPLSVIGAHGIYQYTFFNGGIDVYLLWDWSDYSGEY